MSNNNIVQSASTTTQSPRSRLLELPNEILQEIACCLPSDRDVLHLSQSCKEMWAKVFEYESAIWRDRFAKHYDLAPGKPSRDLMFEYQIRAIVLSAPIQFKEEEDDRQYLWMEVIQNMLEESLKLPIALGETSKTLQRIRETLKGVDFLSEFQKERTSSQLFYALQLCLTSFALDPAITEPCRRTDYDIRQVYSYEERVGEAFIDHDDLDLAKLLNLRNFWQRHFLNASELTYQESFSGLPAELKPKIRKDNPTETSELSTSWLGYYSCMHPLSDLQMINERQTCADLETHGDSIDIMTLDLQPSSDQFWPEQCRKIIPLASEPDTKRTYFDELMGGGYEAGNHVFGFTEEIAVPHGGFEGWARICFIIVEADEEESNEEEEEMPSSTVMDGEGWIHGYEAIVIPGGRLMLGRWVDMKEPEARGPFIFWDV
ncbi:Major facilitator superfamily domain general substrate transporter [Penicillium coprophilum]|uniref:Major facilitator superfamily domain general substrate transporter n=1 Tax=Penicillium coprophilum TaxID=36646 RepID=UPI0023A4243E|nr:Major facilitator superfamily domain general substrate transporter [Penicillium coprophilum]KAJ5150575.1 Major facilitator superfamily domain general substrate transporter [Penicillium coprophilum]